MWESVDSYGQQNFILHLYLVILKWFLIIMFLKFNFFKKSGLCYTTHAVFYIKWKKKSRHLSIFSMGRWNFQGQMSHKKHILKEANYN